MYRLIRFSLPKILTYNNVRTENMILPFLIKRHNYESSGPVPKPEELPKYEVTKDEKEWEFVERLLPFTYVPLIPQRDEYPSGWVPQEFNPELPYSLKRSKNGMLPIYLVHSYNRGRRITKVAHIHGNLWQFAEDLQNYLERIENKKMKIRVHEITGAVQIHGDHVSNCKVWALKNKL